MSIDPNEEVRATFYQECEERLGDLEQGLLQMEKGAHDSETVNAVFRAVHSIKGGAGAFGMDPLVRFAHVFETTLDDMRSNRLPITQEVMRVMLRAADVLSDHVTCARDGSVPDEAHSAALVAAMQALDRGGANGGGGGDGHDAHGASPAPAATQAAEPTPAGPREWHINFRPAASMYAKANDAVLLLRELSRLGTLQVTLDASALPPLDEIDPESSYLSWSVRLQSEASEAEIREIFDFVEEECPLEIRAPAGAEAPPAAAVEPVKQAAPTAPPPVAAPPASAEPAAAPAAAAPAATPPPAAKAAPAAAAVAPPTIRVDLERVDRLINLVGELVIDQAVLAQRVVEAGLARSSDVAVGLEELEQLTREIQDSVMAIRAQPVRSVFQRMPRLVREVCSMTGKPAQLVTEGEGTEVDKTVIERLTDPITHMIRNAIDHGLEPVAKRLAAGKPAEGTIRLTARHRSGRIVIEVSDDGGGINRDVVRKKAVERGLIAAGATLSDEETDNLIFLPGFSTAETITDVSGRGVGMDVVRRSIQDLGGRISITSIPGKGSTFSMSLPLTLAVLDGMVVSVDTQTLVVPLTAIIETLQPRTNNLYDLGSGTVMAVRENYVPLIDVGAVLGYRDEAAPPTNGVTLLVESEGRGRVALLVDAIQGQRQVVIKSLESNYGRVEGIAAATILGDGRVALILDVDAVIACRRRLAYRAADVPQLETAS
jgi:two-component system chemotaxis sensor kinase CheA